MVGSLSYKVKYERSTQKLHATVVKCSDLPKGGLLEGKYDPYVRVYLMPGTHTELKTKVVKASQNPVFNDEFSFVLSPNDVKKKTIVFQVWDQDKFSKDDGIGEVQVPLWNIHDLETKETEMTVGLGKLTSKGKGDKPVLQQRRPSEMGRASLSSAHSTMERQTRQSNMEQSSYHQEQYTRQSYTTNSSVAGATAFTSGSSSSMTRQKSKESSSSSSSDEEETRRSVSQLSHSSSQGAMSLHELNNRLEKYIRQIQLTPDGPNVSIGVERVSEGGNFNINDMPQYHEYERLMTEYTEQEEELARVEADIAILTHENEDYQERLRSLQMKIEEKRREITILESKIKEFENTRISRQSTLIDNKIHNARVSVNHEKAGFIDRLKSLQWETITTTEEMQNEDEIRRQIKEEYDIRLKEEIEKIRLLYKNYEGEMKISIKSIFDKKIAELKALREDWSSKEKAEVDSILDRLEEAKRRIIELEKRKLDLSHDERRLSDQYEEEELRYKTMLAAKKAERDYLEQQYTELQIQYSKFETDRSGYFREVDRYGRILKEEHPTRVSRHAEKFYDANLMVEDNDSSSSSSSSSDEGGNDAYQQQKSAYRSSSTSSYSYSQYTSNA